MEQKKRAKKQTYREMGLGDIFNVNLDLICKLRDINDDEVMDYMNICRSTFYDRKLHHPGRWTAENIDSAAKLFRIPSGMLTAKILTPGEVA